MPDWSLASIHQPHKVLHTGACRCASNLLHWGCAGTCTFWSCGIAAVIYFDKARSLGEIARFSAEFVKADAQNILPSASRSLFGYNEANVTRLTASRFHSQ